MPYWLTTPSGTSFNLKAIDQGPAQNREAYDYSFQVTSTGGGSQPVVVRFDKAPMVSMTLKSHLDEELTSDRRDLLAKAAVLRAVDQNPNVLSTDEEVILEVDASNVVELAAPPPIGNRAIRRYLARRAFMHWDETDLKTPIEISELDRLITGADDRDFLRNAQVLAEEDYLELRSGGSGSSFAFNPTAKLIREVERFGAAKPDAISEDDYEDRLKLYPALASALSDLLREKGRFAAASSYGELASVFRATAPIVESLLRELLGKRGSKKELSTLGPIIGEMKSMDVGDTALISQVNHVLKFARDLEQHGQQLPEPVLRIACENAFELVPQIGALF